MLWVHVSVEKQHYENTPIQIYWKFHYQKLKVSDKNSDVFHTSAQNIDCGYPLEPPRRNKKTSVYSCKPQFYCIKVGFKGVKII